ncbi:MAG: response regulator transcription factor [Candidatus Rokuibacteriota bacterium]
MSGVTRVLLVDDHPMVREGLQSMLRGTDVEVIGEAATAAEALRAVAERPPDVVLLDMKLPDLDGLAALAGLRRAAPAAAIVVVSMIDDVTVIRRALDAGARGWLLKGVGRRDLLAAVRAAAQGATVVDPALVRPPAVAPGPEAAGVLTAPERDVLRLITQGLTNRQIAERMRWSLGTAKKYVQRVLDKLAVSDRTQAAAEAIRRGLA